jgi:hypothetical protein
MLVQDIMWDIFQHTGNIGAYLLYRQCSGCLLPEGGDLPPGE